MKISLYSVLKRGCSECTGCRSSYCGLPALFWQWEGEINGGFWRPLRPWKYVFNYCV